MVRFSRTVNPVFKDTAFLKSNISKTVHHKDKVNRTLVGNHSLPNIWNGTMFDDLD